MGIIDTGSFSEIRVARVSSTTAVMVYRDGGPADSPIRLAKTTNNGNSWTFSTIASPSVGDDFIRPSIWIIDSSNYIVAFMEFTSKEVYFTKTSNGGSSWDTPVLVYTVGGTSPDFRTTDIVAMSSTKYGIAWSETSSGVESFKYSKSTDSGANWGSAVTIDTGTWGNTTVSIDVIDSTNLVCAYRKSTTQINYATSSDSGDNWSTGTVQSATGNPIEIKVSAISSSKYIITWQDFTAFDAEYSVTTTSGSSWSHTTLEADINTGAHISHDVIDSSTYIITWLNDGTNLWKFIKTTDGGSSFGSIVTMSTAVTSAFGQGITWFSLTNYVAAICDQNLDVYVRNSTNSGSNWADLGASISESFSTTDDKAFSVTTNKTETFTTSDSIVPGIIHDETFTTTESPTFIISTVKDETVSVADTIAFIASIVRNDSASVTDTIQFLTSKVLNDSFNTIDTKIYGPYLTEQLSVHDSTNLVISIKRIRDYYLMEIYNPETREYYTLEIPAPINLRNVEGMLMDNPG